jgi:hypothetical protein
MGRYLSIAHRIITPNLVRVPLCEEMEYEPLARQIQNVVSICYFLYIWTKLLHFIYGLIISICFILCWKVVTWTCSLLCIFCFETCHTTIDL